MRYLILLTLFLVSCGVPVEAGQPTIEKFLSHYAKTGKPMKRYGAKGNIYIGHRLGADFKGIGNNTIKGAEKIQKYESHPAFKKYEMDVNSAKDTLVNCHDWYLDSERKSHTRLTKYPAKRIKKKCPAFSKQVDKIITELRPGMPISIDIKRVNRKEWPILLAQAEKLKSYYGDELPGLENPVRFQTHCNKRKEYKDLIRKIKAEGYKITFYYNKCG